MFHYFEGIVLRARSYGESNQIVTVVTKSRGKLAFMARGSKKTRSRFGSVTEPFTKAAFVCFGTKGMLTLSQADLLHSHQTIRTDLLLTAYAAYWVELLDKLTEENEPVPYLYQVFETALQKLQEGTDKDILTRIIELRMMEQAGFKPVLKHCVYCQTTTELIFFSVHQGGFLCEQCRGKDKKAHKISLPTSRILSILQQMDLTQLGQVNVKQATQEQLENVLEKFMSEYVHSEIKSRNILKQMRKLEYTGG